MNANKIVVAAINRIKSLDKEYFIKTMNQRIRDHQDQAGSIITGMHNADTLEHELRTANYAPFRHPSIASGCFGFVTTQITGLSGIVELSDMNDEYNVTLDDRKGTGKVSCTISESTYKLEREKLGYTVVITGPENDKDGNTVEVLYTVHPGEPVNPSQVTIEPGMHGKVVSVKEAMELGLTTAKIVK